MGNKLNHMIEAWHLFDLNSLIYALFNLTLLFMCKIMCQSFATQGFFYDL